MAAKEKNTLEVACPDCGSVLTVDAKTGAVLHHTPAPHKRTFESLETAAQAMREAEQRKQSLFQQSVDAEKNRNELLDKKFAEAFKRAQQSPASDKPFRDFDLD